VHSAFVPPPGQTHTDALLDLLDVLHDLIGHEAMRGTELLGAQSLE
jgi:hypothetical protein